MKMGRFSDAVLSVCGVGIFIWLFYFAYSLHYKTSLTECTRTYVKDILNTESLLEDSNALKAKLRILEKRIMSVLLEMNCMCAKSFVRKAIRFSLSQ